MSVRTKTLIVIGLTFLALLGILYFTVRWLLLRDANITEDKSIARDVTRLQAALGGQFTVLDATVADWAQWDDTYNFIGSGDTAYLDSNLPDSEFTSLGVEFMLFINNSGEIVFGKMVDLDSGAGIPIPDSLHRELQAGSRLLSHKDPTEKMTGILSLPDGPMIISSQAIVTSQGEGPIHGTLIMGRRLNDKEIAKLGQTTQLSLSAFPYNSAVLPQDVALARNSLVGVKPIFVADQNEKVDSGYTLINDVYGQPALIWRADTPRYAYLQAKTSVLYLGWALLSIGIALCLVTMFLLERTVIVRLTSLNSDVLKVGSQGTASSRVEANGNDEISALAASVNSMLSSLQDSRAKERESEERYANLATVSPVGIFRTDQNGATTYVNPMYCQMSGLSVDEALGAGWLSAVHPEDKESLTKGWQDTTRVHRASRADYRFVRPDGTVAWVMGQAIPEMNSENEVVGYVGTITDITERKRAEETLRQRLAELEALHKVSAALRSASTGDEALPVLLDETLTAMDTDAGAIWLYDPEHAELRAAVTRGWFRQLNQTPMKPGEGIAGTVFASGQTHVSAEFRNDPVVRAQAREESPRGSGSACVPIRSGAVTVGVLFVSLPLQRQVSAEQVKLLESLAGIAGASLHRMRLYEETLRQLDQLRSLHDIDRAISGSFDLKMTLNVILEQAATRLQMDAAAVLLLNPHILTLEHTAGRGFRMPATQHAPIRLGEGFAGRAALARHTIQADDVQMQENPHSAALWAGEGFVAYYGVPLIAKGEVKGVLEVFHRVPFAADSNWVNFLETLANRMASAIDNAQLFENLQRSNVDLSVAYDRTIEGWSHALDLRDKETEGHTLRVTELALRLARAAGVGEAELVHTRRGALLHDIGKMGVPDSILLKRDKLTDDEWKVISRHPQVAYDMLSPIAYLKPALDIPYCHHEKWDGTGYPRGLKGEQIPLAARLFAVVDVWDALRADRPYREAWPEEKVLQYIKAGSGTHFDPKAVELFLNMLSEEARGQEGGAPSTRS